MKKCLTFFLLIICTTAFAQDSLKIFSYARIRTTTTGMEVLGSWGIANVALGAAGWANSTGGSNRSFYKMTTIWGATNIGASLFGYFRSNRSAQLNAPEVLGEQFKIERTFLINGALDVVYIGAGTYLKIRGDSHHFDDLRGYGSAIIIQGVFLLLFDGTMYSAERRNGNKLILFLQKHPVAFNGRTIGFSYRM